MSSNPFGVMEEAESVVAVAEKTYAVEEVPTNTGIAGPLPEGVDVQRELERAQIRLDRMQERAAEDGVLSDPERARFEGQRAKLDDIRDRVQDSLTGAAGSAIQTAEDELGIGDVAGDVTDAIDEVTGAADDAVDAAKNGAIDALDSVTDGAASSVIDAVDSVTDVVPDAIDGFGEATGANDMADMLGSDDGLVGLMDGRVLATVGGAVVHKVGDLAEGAIDGVDVVVGAAGDVIEDGLDAVGDAAEDVVEDPIGTAGDAVDAAADAASDVADAGADVAGDVIDAGSDVIDGAGDVIDDLF